jgi:acetolactate synthase I/II/III large subunit
MALTSRIATSMRSRHEAEICGIVADNRPRVGRFAWGRVRRLERQRMYTASTAFLDSLQEAGVEFIFANFGSDHPGLIEAISEARAEGREIPRVVTCPNEMLALSCAQGCAQLTGRAQAVVVHVDCGTLSLGGAVHNVARCRAPVLIYAGMSPATQEGELLGGRNEFIHWLQDVPDQRGILRQYMKYDHEIRSSRNVPQIVHRALQIAESDPKGPVYLVAARETMEAGAEPLSFDQSVWRPVPSAPLPDDAVAEVAVALANARRPVVVTSYLGRNAAAVAELTRFCRGHAVGVLESAPYYMNYPQDDDMYLGAYWNDPVRNPVLAEADVVVVIDSDVPWIPSVNAPSSEAAVFHIDVDPLKETIPLWYIRARRSLRADGFLALRQINAWLDARPPQASVVAERRDHFGALHRRRADELAEREAARMDIITPEWLTACVRRAVGDEAIILSEGVTNYPAIHNHASRRVAGTMFASGGSSLGWSGGAAIGMKLMAPDRMVVALTGDGSYMFSTPSAVHWLARRHRTPFLQIVYNNRGWNAPRFSALAVHPHGYASRANDLDIGFDPPPDYAGIAVAAGGALALMVKRPEEVEAAIRSAIRAVVEEKRSAVIDAWV